MLQIEAVIGSKREWLPNQNTVSLTAEWNGVNARDDAVLSTVAGEVDQIEAKGRVTIIVVDDKTPIHKNENVAEGAVEFHRNSAAESLSGISISRRYQPAVFPDSDGRAVAKDTERAKPE